SKRDWSSDVCSSDLYSPDCLCLGTWVYSISRIYRNWYLGTKQNHWLGLGYYQLCLVGRYWTRRYVNFRSSSPLPSEMAYGSKQICRSDDHFRSSTSRIIPVNSHGTYLACVLGSSYTKPIRISLD